MTIIAPDNPNSLSFASSQSKAVDAGGIMINRFVKDHASRQPSLEGSWRGAAK